MAHDNILRYQEFNESIKPSSKDIVITIPKEITWANYRKELEKAADGEVLHFKVMHFPKTEVGAKCYILHDGFIRGYMLITGLSEKTFVCSTTGKKWSGKFIERSGLFYNLKNKIPMKGFQGFRYMTDELL